MEDEKRYLPAKKVLQRYGISAMSLWRWERDPFLPFPAPMKINDRKFYALNEIEAWERVRASTGSAAAANTGSSLRAEQSKS